MFCHIGYSAPLLLPPSRSTGPTLVAQMNASLPLSCWDLKNRVQKRTERIVFMITHKNNEFTTKKLNRGVTMNFSKASIKQQNLARITNMQFTWFKTRLHKYIQNFSGDSTLKVSDEKQKILVVPEHFFHALNQVYWVICLWIQRGCLKGNSLVLPVLPMVTPQLNEEVR